MNRPIIGGNNTIINRPGGNTIISNRPGGNTNINVNRPGWGHPGWGYGPGHGSWAQNWHDHYVNHHHNYWYHGCWSGHWGNNWYVPLVYGATAWGLAAILPQWGYNYGYTYVNPYYVPTAVSTYNYSQPLVVNNYYADDNARRPPNRRSKCRAIVSSIKPSRRSRPATTERHCSWTSKPSAKTRTIPSCTSFPRCACLPRATTGARRPCSTPCWPLHRAWTGRR